MDNGWLATPRYLQAMCLEALRCDRDKWKTRMPGGLFNGIHQAIYKGIMESADPTDPVQVVDAMGTEQPMAMNEIAAMLNGSIAFTPNDEGVVWRLAKLQSLRRREKLEETLKRSSEAMKSGGNVEDIVQNVTDAGALDDTGLLGAFEKASSLDDAVDGEDPVRPPALVRKVIYPNGLSVLAGPGGLGKSWLAIDMALQMVQAEFWLGLQCKESRVGYVSLEMHSAGVRDRIKKLTGGKMSKEARDRFFYIGQENIGRAIDIMDETFRMSFAAWVTEKKLDLVIVDPLRNAHTQDENSSTEMGNVLRCFSELGCSVLLIHHVSKEGLTRGSTAIRDWADAVVTLSKLDDELRLGWEKRPRHDAVAGDIPLGLFGSGDRISIKRTDK